MNIKILKHSKIGNAEKEIISLSRERGHSISIINPRNFSLGLLNKKFADVIISRCELNSLTEPIFIQYIEFLHMCQANNIPIINRPDFIINGQDKYLSHLKIENFYRSKRKKTPNPETYISFNLKKSLTLANKIISTYGSVVIKNPYGGRGQGINLFKNKVEVHNFIENHFRNKKNALLFQQPIRKKINNTGGFCDIRAFACRSAVSGQVEFVGAYYRNSKNGQFLTNISKNGYISTIKNYRKDLIELVKNSLIALDGDIAGIDIAEDESGRLYFLEVNISFETCKNTLSVVGNDIWVRLLDYVESLNCKSQF